jgi:hypothetical protein
MSYQPKAKSVPAHIHTYIQTYIHTHTHTFTSLSLSLSLSLSHGDNSRSIFILHYLFSLRSGHLELDGHVLHVPSPDAAQGPVCVTSGSATSLMSNMLACVTNQGVLRSNVRVPCRHISTSCKASSCPRNFHGVSNSAVKRVVVVEVFEAVITVLSSLLE